jgi:acyl dehydratase
MTLDVEAPERLRATAVAQLHEHIGTELGLSRWRLVTEDDVDAFADLTGDRQWIHTDPVRAAAGPFGGTIAHGYYTLSLAPALLDELVSFEGFAMAVNYGLDKLRFPAPLLIGDSVRLRAALTAVESFRGGAALTLLLTFESSRGGKPVCVAQAVYRVFEHDHSAA